MSKVRYNVAMKLFVFALAAAAVALSAVPEAPE